MSDGVIEVMLLFLIAAAKLGWRNWYWVMTNSDVDGGGGENEDWEGKDCFTFITAKEWHQGYKTCKFFLIMLS